MAIGKNAHLPYKQCPNCKGKGIVKCVCDGNPEKGIYFGCEKCFKAWGYITEHEFYKSKHGGTLPCSRCNGTGEIKRV